MMQETQLLKGILEGCVLGIIARGETYGYEILSVLESAGLDVVGEGTLYPVLTRLDKNGYIQCRRAKSPLGPIRKYYTITLTGKKYLEEFKKNYRKITESAGRVLTGNSKKAGREAETDGLQLHDGTA
ncbi:MAG: PadR family transcriptional regulator [Eubacterium sp.]|nr:PadR family transcriptional regulator [Eubacterium sp.]